MPVGRPVATERLSALPDGRLLYRLKRPWRDGTCAIIFEPQDLIALLLLTVSFVTFFGAGLYVVLPAAILVILVTLHSQLQMVYGTVTKR